jgi:DNA replication protein DnaC
MRRERSIDEILWQNRIDACRERNNVPERFKRARLNDVYAVPVDCQEPYLEAIKELEEMVKHASLKVLIGSRGPGKTHMACGLVNAFCDQGRSAKYMTAMDYILDIRKSYSGGESQEQRELEYIKLSLLVLDELQERGDTPNEDRLLTRIIDKRYAANRATVLISNQTESQFIARIGVSVADRINEGGGIIVCDWPSLRGRIKELA